MAKSKVQAVKPGKAIKPERVLEQYRQLTRTRYEIAQRIYEHQDGLTKEVIDAIRDRLVLASTGVVNVNGVPMKLEPEFVNFNIWFLACEILSDLAAMGIQVANFDPSPLYCANCKQEILGVKKVKKRR